WSAVDGAYAKRRSLRVAKQENFIVVGRLRKDKALWCAPEPVLPEKRGRGRPTTYRKKRIGLAERAVHKRGWQQFAGLASGNTLRTESAVIAPCAPSARTAPENSTRSTPVNWRRVTSCGAISGSTSPTRYVGMVAAQPLKQ